MNNVFVKFETPENTELNTTTLAAVVRERFSKTPGHFTGYRFLYDSEGDEQILCRRWSPKTAEALRLLVQATKPWEKIQLFRNVDHELAIQIVDLTRRSVRENFTNNNLPVTVLL